MEILSANAGVIADILKELAADLEDTVGGLRALDSSDEAKRSSGAETVEDVLRRGNAGRSRIPASTALPATRPSRS
jgi:prephenate dehydrogenase